MHGLNGLLLAVEAGKGFLSNSLPERAIEVLQPQLGLRPTWATERTARIWKELQASAVTCFGASALAIASEEDRDFAVDYLLALGVDGIADDRQALAHFQAALKELGEGR